MNQFDAPYAIKRENEPVQGDFSSHVPWWSITKTVMAAAILKLVDDGQLFLDKNYKNHPFTIRQLLQHTAGLTTYGGPVYSAAVESRAPAWPVAELLEKTKADKLIYEPDKGWAYSNIGYLFIRHLIEETLETDLGPALQQIIFEPMGILNTHIVGTTEEMSQTRWGQTLGYDPRWVFHGLLAGPPVEAVLFLDNLLHSDFLSLKAKTAMQQITQIGGKIEGRLWTKTGYGLGLMMGEMERVGAVLGHSGAGPSSVSALYCFDDLPARPIVASFSKGADEGLAEQEVVRIALS